MELTLTELVIQLSLALTCVAVAINSRGPVRTSLSGVLATAVVGMTVLLLILGLGTGTFSAIASDVRAERQAAAAEKEETVKVSGRLAIPGEAAEPVTEEMKAPQRMRQEEVAAKERKSLDVGNPAVAAYQETVRPLVARARELGSALRKLKLEGLSEENEKYAETRDQAMKLRAEASALAEEILALKAPKELSATHQLFVGSAEHLRNAGAKAVRFFSAPNASEAQTLGKGTRTSAETSLRALGEFSRQIKL